AARDGGGQAAADGQGGVPGPTPAAVAGSSATPTLSPSSSPSPAPPTVIEIGWVGDTTPGSKYGLPPNGGRALFASVRPQLRRPDLMIANLEGTYSTPGPSKCDGSTSGLCFAFQAPPSFVQALPWAGIDVVNLANNHSYDYFARGLDQTQRALARVRVDRAGMPEQVTVVTVRGVRVAVVGFSPYSWNADVNDIPAATTLVRRAAARADIVVVLMHAGAEGADRTHTPRGSEVAYGELRGDPRAFSHAVVNAGADLVLGSGPHVIRGIERYRNKLIAYSLGNFAGWDNFGLGGNLSLSGLLTVKVDDRGRIHGGRWLSLYVAEPGVPKVDPTNTAAHLVRQLSAADFARTYTLDDRGFFSAR
ncbi:MAG TPA: CapA family protein, partial [Thermoleophilia bacterium]|nr:CapA family protein [Thermoleophilia bacterium]